MDRDTRIGESTAAPSRGTSSFAFLTTESFPMTESITPVAPSDERPFSELKQITVRADDEIAQVNQMLAEGWRLVKIGQRSDATVYVLGKIEEKKRARTGFLAAD